MRASLYPVLFERRAVAFTPAALSPAPSIWLDPSDLTTLFQNSNGTTAVAADGDPVGYMGDKSGNALHVKQSNATGYRPLYKTSGGLSFLRFDGVDDFIGGDTGNPTMSSFLTDTTYDVVCCGVMNNIATNNSGGGVASNDFFWEDNNGYFGFAFRSNAPTGMNAVNNDGAYKSVADAYTGGTAFVAHMRHSAGTLSLTQNARTTVTVATGTTDAGGMASRLNLGGSLGIATFAELDFYGFIARQTLFTAAELANIKTWMGGKVGVVL